MDRRRRNRICLRLVVIGLVNIAVYTLAYAFIGGDAWNGEVRDHRYFVKGHFIHSLEGYQTPVSKAIWVYSYLHSISIWPSLAAIVLSMLVLSRPHILATCRGDLISGNTLVALIGGLVILITATGTITFTISFVQALSR